MAQQETNARISESHFAHFDYVSAIVEITEDGAASLVLQSVDEFDDPIRISPDELAGINAMWARATRADD